MSSQPAAGLSAAAKRRARKQKQTNLAAATAPASSSSSSSSRVAATIPIPTPATAATNHKHIYAQVKTKPSSSSSSLSSVASSCVAPKKVIVTTQLPISSSSSLHIIGSNDDQLRVPLSTNASTDISLLSSLLRSSIPIPPLVSLIHDYLVPLAPPQSRMWTIIMNQSRDDNSDDIFGGEGKTKTKTRGKPPPIAVAKWQLLVSSSLPPYIAASGPLASLSRDNTQSLVRQLSWTPVHVPLTIASHGQVSLTDVIGDSLFIIVGQDQHRQRYRYDTCHGRWYHCTSSPFIQHSLASLPSSSSSSSSSVPLLPVPYHGLMPWHNVFLEEDIVDATTDGREWRRLRTLHESLVNAAGAAIRAGRPTKSKATNEPVAPPEPSRMITVHRDMDTIRVMHHPMQLVNYPIIVLSDLRWKHHPRRWDTVPDTLRTDMVINGRAVPSPPFTESIDCVMVHPHYRALPATTSTSGSGPKSTSSSRTIATFDGMNCVTVYYMHWGTVLISYYLDADDGAEDHFTSRSRVAAEDAACAYLQRVDDGTKQLRLCIASDRQHRIRQVTEDTYGKIMGGEHDTSSATRDQLVTSITQVSTWCCTYDPRTMTWDKPRFFHKASVDYIYPLIEPIVTVGGNDKASSATATATATAAADITKSYTYDRVVMLLNANDCVNHQTSRYSQHFYTYDLRNSSASVSAAMMTPLVIPWPVGPHYETDRVLFIPPSTMIVMDGDSGRWHIMDLIAFVDHRTITTANNAAAKQSKSKQPQPPADNHKPKYWFELPPIPFDLLPDHDAILNQLGISAATDDAYKKRSEMARRMRAVVVC